MRKVVHTQTITQNELELIQMIYQTIEEQSLWILVLEKLKSYMHNGKASITIRSNTTGFVDTHDLFETRASGFEQSFINDYITSKYKIDTWIPIEAKHNTGEICLFSEHQSIEVLEKTAFYQQWLKPQKINDGIAVQLYKTASFRIVLNVFYQHNDDDVKRITFILQKLLPFLCQATSLSAKITGISDTENYEGRGRYLQKAYGLSDRESQVAYFYSLYNGSNEIVSTTLNISVNTVKSYLKNICQKMQLEKTKDLVALQIFKNQ